MGKIWTGKLSDVMTHEPRMRTWDWRLFTWLSLLWRNWRWQKVTCSRNTDSYLCLWCMKTYSRSHPWHPLLQWCSAPELKARWWWTRRGRRSEVSTKHRETKLIMQITFKMEHKGSVRYRDSYVEPQPHQRQLVMMVSVPDGTKSWWDSTKEAKTTKLQYTGLFG